VFPACVFWVPAPPRLRICDGDGDSGDGDDGDGGDDDALIRMDDRGSGPHQPV
jgi:hypothetical protein